MIIIKKKVKFIIQLCNKINYMSKGKLEAIWIKTPKPKKEGPKGAYKKGPKNAFSNGPMVEVKKATMITNKGMVGNANQGGRRQVTIMEKEVWASLMDELNIDHPPSARRANLMVSNFPLKETTDQVLKIGPCYFKITMETEPCELMNICVSEGLYPVMSHDWAGGACTKVIKGGEIKVGDSVSWVNEKDVPSDIPHEYKTANFTLDDFPALGK